MKPIIKYILIAIFTSVAIFFLFGIPTALIPNRFFTRMIIPTTFDYLILVLTSLLLGAYISLSFYKRSKEKKCDYIAYGGGISGIFAVGCPICNVLIISLFSASAILTYFEPLRPLLGLISVGLVGSAVIFRTREIYIKRLWQKN